MTFETRDLLKRIAFCAAFVMVLAADGCSRLWTSPPVTSAPLERDGALPDGGAADSAAPDTAPQTVNIFGELNGMGVAIAGPGGQGGFQQHTYTDEGYDSEVAVDPSGKWMAFASTRHSDHADLYLQRVDGTAVIQLTDEAADEAYPAFSPDGKQIAFSSTRTGNWQIFVMDTDGRNVTQITSGQAQAIHPSWSPDGTRLVYSSLGGRSSQWELWTANLQSDEKRMIGYGLFPVWSPERSVDRIAFQRARQRGSRWFSLWTAELQGGEARKITEVAVSSRAAVVSPSWSPDGRRLAFSAVTEPGGTSHGRKSRSDVWIVETDGQNRRRLTGGNSTNLGPCWAADNRIYFISDRSSSECVWSVRVESAATVTADAGKAGQGPTQRQTVPAGTADIRDVGQ